LQPMDGGRTRYGLAATIYHWAIGATGILLLAAYTYHPWLPQRPAPFIYLFLFFAMHVVASFLHFQNARWKVVVTFESSFTMATLLVFGTLSAIWISAIGILLGSTKRFIFRRYVLHQQVPLGYDLGVIAFNCGMMTILWLTASWVYLA